MRVTRYRLSYPLENEKYLLINTLTGALDIVEERVINYLNALEEGNKGELDEEIIESLKKRGYILEDNKDSDILNKMVNYYEEHNNILAFTVCPTYSCNLRCPYCFEDESVKKQEKVLSIAEIDRIFECIDEIASKKKIEKKKIQLFGGEPFQATTKESVEYIFKKAVENDCSIVVITNGTNVELFKDILISYKDRIEYIQITVDGAKEVHDRIRISAKKVGSFDKITESIQMLLDIGISVVARVNIGKETIKSLNNLFEFYENKGWTKYKNFVTHLAPINDHCRVGNVYNWMPESEILKELNSMFGDIENIRDKYKVILGTDIEKRTNLIRSIWKEKINSYKSTPLVNPCACGAGSRIYYVFGAEGKIYPCPETVGHEEYSIGSYLPDFYIDETKDISWKRNVTNIDKCKNCSIAPLCGAACTWSSIAVNGINFKDPICNYAKETIDNFFEINKNKIMKRIVKES